MIQNCTRSVAEICTFLAQRNRLAHDCGNTVDWKHLQPGPEQVRISKQFRRLHGKKLSMQAQCPALLYAVPRHCGCALLWGRSAAPLKGVALEHTVFSNNNHFLPFWLCLGTRRMFLRRCAPRRAAILLPLPPAFVAMGRSDAFADLMPQMVRVRHSQM